MRKRGFTLVELLVVIAIIGLLSTVVLITTKGLRNRAEIAKSLTFDRQVENVLGAYLVGRWSFDEESGNTVLDTSGWDNHGTITGATRITDTLLNKGKVLKFNGTSSQYVTIPHDISLKPTEVITISAWFNTEDRDQLQTVFSTTESGGYALYFNTDSNLRFSININEGYYSIDYPLSKINNNQWYHSVGVFDKNAVRLYINGIEVGSRSVSGNIYYKHNNPLCIGSEAVVAGCTGGGYYFLGLIDEVKLYNKSLNFTEIQYEYYVGLDKLLVKGLMTKEEYQDKLSYK